MWRRGRKRFPYGRGYIAHSSIGKRVVGLQLGGFPVFFHLKGSYEYSTMHFFHNVPVQFFVCNFEQDSSFSQLTPNVVSFGIKFYYRSQIQVTSSGTQPDD